jgi:ribosomal protein L7Ae-like RNA K-turn-binding protein
VCPGRPCLEQALRRGGFARRLKVPLASTDLTALEDLIRQRASGKVVSLLGLARRARKVVSGAEAVESAMRRRRARLILTAIDASAGSVEKIRALARATGTACYRLLSKEELGAAVGGAPRSCIVVTDSHFADALVSILAKYPPDTISAPPRPAKAMSPHGRAATREVWR